MTETILTEHIRVAIVLPESLTRRLDEFVRLRVGESREILVQRALDEFITVTEQRLERQKRALATRPTPEPDPLEWEANFQKLEEIAVQTRVVNDEEMDTLISEAVTIVRNENSSETT